ncbi:MAG: thioesterase family protein [Leptospira sp.]|nr:thioesterase family protein [Leptospira sp.]
MEKKPFCFSIRVRYSEVDSQGIVFNANYLNYFDILVGEYFREKVGSYKDFVETKEQDYHVIRSLIEYRNPARYDDVLLFTMTGTCKGPKIFWKIKARLGEKTICEAELDYIAVHTKTGKVTSILDEIAKLLDLQSVDL